MVLIQRPEPGTSLLYFAGDIIEFRLESAAPLEGCAFVRTNLGNNFFRISEIVDHGEKGIPPPGQDWQDLPMKRVDKFTFTLRVRLAEVGHFEAKCFLMGEAGKELFWPEGENLHINVEPAAHASFNSIYCAFVRQFGENCNREKRQLPEGITPELLEKLDAANYTVIPPSGTFRDLIGKLDHIFDTLHSRILHLLPVHPAPTTYGKMGRFGSPYASTDFTAVNPEYAQFDRKATPLDQFCELVDAVHRKGGKLFLDIAINHTGWAAKLHETHPQWLVKEEDGTIHSPGAWGVVWGDLTELDHSIPELWHYLAGVFRIWCMRGVDGFRCDAGYMIPHKAWEYIIAKIREEFPDTVFLLEGLGGDPAVTRELLDTANMNWAYSELFQNYTREQIEHYLTYAWKESSSTGLMVHYAETHDNNRLAATSPEYALNRTALAALTSDSGSFGFTNGVEWFAGEKIDVHENSALNWGAIPNQVERIALLNTLLATHPAFGKRSRSYFIDCTSPEGLLFCRCAANGEDPLLIAVNLNTTKGITLSWNPRSVLFDALEVWDIAAGRKTEFVRETPQKVSLRLSGGQISIFSPVKQDPAGTFSLATATLEQEAGALALKTLSLLEKSPAADEQEDPIALGKELLVSPEGFLRKYGPREELPPYVSWHYPNDTKRCVMIPPGMFLILHADVPFRAHFSLHGKVVSLSSSLLRQDPATGKTDHFAILPPPREQFSTHTEGKLSFVIFGEKAHRGESPLLFLAEEDEKIESAFSLSRLQKGNFRYFRGNGRGGCTYISILPEKLPSRYDSLLLANFHKELPIDRHILLRRFRLYLISRNKTWSVDSTSLKNFHLAADKGGVWEYELPAGNGIRTSLFVKLKMEEEKNHLSCSFYRPRIQEGKKFHHLPDGEKITLLLRPDLEDRSFHGETRSNMGPEREWPGRIKARENHLLFSPAPERHCSIVLSKGNFERNDEWSHIWQEEECNRGLEPRTDLYSPGFFAFSMEGGELVSCLVREDMDLPEELPPEKIPLPAPCDFHPHTFTTEELLEDSMAQFVVKREELKSVIAGYPWFLDWGRDTLIAARGLLLAPQFRKDVKEILLNFASFAEKGTIPNMICGEDAGNRDTTDAPLWLFALTRDLCRIEGKKDILSSILPRKGKTLLETLEELAEDLLSGTPNGIKADEESLLLYSPSHFTWMDTNYPAGTPREGYPVEIQALWYCALEFLGETAGERAPRYKEMAEKVRKSFLTCFVLPQGYLSDCLHGKKGVPAREAIADDHLRPNALYAITLGLLKKEEDREIMETLLQHISSLLVPGAIRTLADKPTDYPLPIYDAVGNLLNSPNAPYEGRYEGNEDSCRKKAYHNGTCWTLPFPLYSESLFLTRGEKALPLARSILSSSFYLFRKGGCIGQLPEILDGDAPHTFRGCQAQAWGITELYRVWKILKK